MNKKLEIMECVKNIKIGDYLQMGTYYKKPILWRCVDIDENGPLMLSDKIICLKPFDVSGNNVDNSHGRGCYEEDRQGGWRQDYGSNYWGDSNIRDWLNSSASSGNVVWTCGNAPSNDKVYYNAYDQEAGFLSNFVTNELNIIKEVTQKSLLDGYEESDSLNIKNLDYHRYNTNILDVVQNYDTAYSEQVTDKMFLLDVKQINMIYNNRNILGNDYYIGEPTEDCVSNSKYENSYLNTNKKWKSWLRTPCTCNCDSNTVRFVSLDGEINDNGACNDTYGIRPAFYLNLNNIKTTGSGEIINPYIIVK